MAIVKTSAEFVKFESMFGTTPIDRERERMVTELISRGANPVFAMARSLASNDWGSSNPAIYPRAAVR